MIIHVRTNILQLITTCRLSIQKCNAIYVSTVMRIIKFKIFPVPVRLHSSYGKLIFFIISPFFAIFKNVLHSLEPGETPSYSASYRAPNYAQRSYNQQNILKRVRFGSVAVEFSLCLCSVLQDNVCIFGLRVCKLTPFLATDFDTSEKCDL